MAVSPSDVIVCLFEERFAFFTHVKYIFHPAALEFEDFPSLQVDLTTASPKGLGDIDSI